MAPSILNNRFITDVTRLGLTPDCSVAIGVSGGADSMALALLASEYFNTITFLTVNHGLRPEAASETKQVQLWLADKAGQHKILTHTGETPSEGLQDWARQLRFQLMETWCFDNKIGALLLAHHQGDQAETVLMRLMRGSGVDGLAGMRDVAGPLMVPEGPKIYRPLLEVSKADLIEFLNVKNQPWIEDPSNKNERFKRVQARNWLNALPDSDLLIPRFSETASRFGRVKDLLDSLVDDAMKASVEIGPSGIATLKPDSLSSLHEELGLRLLSRLVRAIGGNDYPARMERLMRLFEALQTDDFSAATLGGVQFVKTKIGISVFREVSNCENNLELISDKSVFWDGRYLVTLEGKTDMKLQIGALGQKGWEDLLNQKTALNESQIPHLARLSLPAIWLKDEVISVPSLDFLKNNSVSIKVEFKPRNPLIKG